LPGRVFRLDTYKLIGYIPLVFDLEEKSLQGLFSLEKRLFLLPMISPSLAFLNGKNAYVEP
jgi:hypothetical protein